MRKTTLMMATILLLPALSMCSADNAIAVRLAAVGVPEAAWDRL